MYEMSVGKELAGLEPTNTEYESVVDKGTKNIIRKIFSREKGRFKMTAEKVWYKEGSVP